MTKILAVYGTTDGGTERIVRRIARRLAEQGYVVRVAEGNDLPRSARLDDYDGFLVVASAIPGRGESCVQEFVGRNALRLNTAPSAFVCVCGAARSPVEEHGEARRYMDEFLRKTGWRPRITEMVAVPPRPRRARLVMRWAKGLTMRRALRTQVSWKYEVTDWAAVDRFADELGDILAQGTLHASV